jgi:hypothetical protein
MAGSQRTINTSVRIVSKVDDRTARHFYELYEKTFGPMAIMAVNRHLLWEHEFMEVMQDERIDKYLVCDDDSGDALGMCTLTNDLETVTWVSPQYFAHHYPDHAARKAIYYLGFSLASSEHRRAQIFTQLITSVTETLVNQNAMCAYDICAYNNEVLGLGYAVESMITALADIEVRPVDTQTYYTAVPHGPLKNGETRRVPGQRPTVEGSP